MRVDLVARVR